jgi:hypothetical protein
MDFENQRRLGPNRPAIINSRGFVGGAHLAQHRTAGFENFGNSESTTDLNQLTSGDDHLIARWRGGEVAQDKDQRSRAVVDHRSCFRGAQHREVMFHVASAATAAAFAQVVFKIGELRGRVDNRRSGFSAQGRPTQICMNHNPRRIDDRLDAAEAKRIDCFAHILQRGLFAIF